MQVSASTPSNSTASGSASSSRLARADFVGLGVALAVASWLAFANLGAQALWQDEAQSALLSRTTLEHGIPLGSDGLNFFSQEMGVEYDDAHRWRWHTWLHFYLVAGSFALFGESTAAARAPAALFGVATLLGVFALAWTWWRDRVAAHAAALSLLALVPFWILVRQCRYYSLTACFAVFALLGYARFVQGRRAGVWLYATSVVALFHSHYVYVPPLLAAVLLHCWIFDRTRLRALGKATALALGVCAPWIVWQSGMDYPASYVDELGDPGYWLRNAGIFTRKLLAHGSGLALLVGAVAVAAGIALREGPGELRALTRDRGAAGLCGAGLAMGATLSVVAPDAFFRYLTPLLPLLALAFGGLVAQAMRVHAVAGLALLVGVVALQPLGRFGHELRHDFEGPIEGLVTYLAESVEPGDSVWITYGDMPLKFYLKVRVVGGLTGESLEDALASTPPDWVILRRHTISESRDGAVRAFIEREIDLASFRKVELPFTDTRFENREEPAEHRFRSALGGPPVTLYARRPSGRD